MNQRSRFYLQSFFIVIVIFAFLWGNLALAQTDEERIAELRKQIEILEQQAAQFRDNIATEREKADTLNREISIIKNQISGIEAQISTTSKKIDKTRLEITKVEGSIYDTQKRLERQKEGIGRLLTAVQRYDEDTLLATLVKNPSLADFFRQTEDVNSVNKGLLTLVDELTQEKASLEENQSDLKDKQRELEQLNKQNAVQRSSLSTVKSGKDSLLQQTKGQEQAYQKRLKEIEKQEMQFFTELRTLESKVVAGGLYIVRVTADKVPPKKTKIFQSPQSPYRLTQSYGYTTYARRGAYGGAGHNGIDIASGYGTPIFAAADGEIIANGTNSGWGNWVAMRHPNLYNLVTLYAHMSAFAPLKVGTSVRVGETIGYEGATGKVTGSHLHFSVYREFFTYINEAKKNDLYFNYFEGSLNPLDYL